MAFSVQETGFGRQHKVELSHLPPTPHGNTSVQPARRRTPLQGKPQEQEVSRRFHIGITAVIKHWDLRPPDANSPYRGCMRHPDRFKIRIVSLMERSFADSGLALPTKR